ncbi:hypothetical protein AVEN_212635-1 [Araneus ventricosus]|uniref:Protein preY, mitochondrial n=1 Tax=Araneus ventricosus TaxID=182803 RepID=A0A4Y2NZG3_ARAVE|nr:hypothetical protein AVEN_212635-1 [Araneus ventricosus]
MLGQLLYRRSRILLPNVFHRKFSNEASITSENPNILNSEKLDDRVLNLIVCPLTKKKLRYDSERQLLINDELGIGFKIVNGIPNLVPTDAVKV